MHYSLTPKNNTTMKTTIFILSWCSYTDSDDYLYTDIKTFTDEEEARKQFDDDCHMAYEECEWGSQWDESEENRDEECKYDVDESRAPGIYTVSSEAYDGYKVEVSLEEREIDIPHATDRRKYGMTLKEVRDIIAEFTGDKKSEAMRKAKIFREHCCVPLTCVVSIRLSFGKYSRSENNEIVYYGENRDTLHFEYTDREGYRNQFSIIE